MPKLFGRKSNWEFVVWYLVDPYVTEKHREFTRSEILQENYEEIYQLLKVVGHKKRPEHIEQTIQKTLQNMRDKNWILFFGQGDYKLTDEGYKELLSRKDNIALVKSISSEQFKTLGKLSEDR
jgi:predicted transcriptional regulator